MLHGPRLLALLVLGIACGPVGGEAPREPESPAPVSAPPATPEPAPSSASPESVAAVEPSPAPAPSPEPEPEPAPAPVKPLWSAADEPRILAVQPIVAAAAAEYGVDPHLVNGVIWVESKFRPRAKNRSGARGLMQLMPRTAKALAPKVGRRAQPYDPEFNVHAGTYYLSRLLSRFDGDETLALASYVRGPARVRTWVDSGEPLSSTAQGFVDKVQRARRVFAALGWPAAAAGAEPEAAPPSSSAAAAELASPSSSDAPTSSTASGS